MERQNRPDLQLQPKLLAEFLTGAHMLAFVPALALIAFWTAGEKALVAVALGLPLFFLLTGALAEARAARSRDVCPVTGLPMQDKLAPDLEDRLATCAEQNRSSALYIIQIEELDLLTKRYGQDAANLMAERIGQRFRSTLRELDTVYWMGGARFAVSISPVPHFDLENAIQLAARLQSAAEEPVSFESQILYSSCAIGFCLSARSPESTSAAYLHAADTALKEALRHSPSSIRAYSEEMGRAAALQDQLACEAAAALSNGEIRPYFQPQISTDTGQVTGFEALARWEHPERGIISPALFLPALAATGQLEKLGEVMLHAALEALKSWDSLGMDAPCVAVNFSADELRNPKLADRIRWDLDRFELMPDRLSVEVLESIVAGSPEDAAARNLSKLAEMGCRIDLDDFGTGHASITSIRRFAIERIKIDRSFITNVDKDQEQQRMVSAIQTMAERLGLETVAEGVETPGEHAMLAQLGCSHVQGYGIAHPMPFEQIAGWITAHHASLQKLPQIQSKRS